jgi:hypothetical protein
VVVLVGEADGELMAGLARSGNVSLVHPPAGGAGQQGGGEPAAAQAGWEAGALALRAATGRHSPYVIVTADPLAEVAAAWRAMWDVTAGPGGAAGFEEHAAQALAAWREKRFELPDYYLVVTTAQAAGTGPDFYLGPLRAARPRRVAVAGAVGGGASQGAQASQAGRVLDTLRSLPHGPWWPPLDELIGTARHFYAAGLAETQPGPPGGPVRRSGSPGGCRATGA